MKRMRALLLVGCLAAASPAAAGELRATPADGILTLSGAGLWIGSEAAKPSLAPQACRFCESPVNPMDRETRRALVLDNTHAMSLASNLGGYAVIPAAAGLLTLRSDRTGTTALVVAEAAVLTADLNQAVKFAVGRARPYRQFGHDVGVDPAGGDDYLSFFSGHTAVSFSLASATYAWMRAENEPRAPLAGALLFTGAAFVGYSRIAADRHYLSDVLTGALVGTAIGWLTVESHRAGSGSVRVDASPAALRLSLAL